MNKDLIYYSDNELYNLLSNGNEKEVLLAFDEIYRRYSAKVYTYCMKIMNYDSSGQDIFQDTFTKFLESAKKEKDMTNVAGYLIKIARNLCINEKSKKRNETISLEDLELPSLDKSYDKKQLEDLLQTALEAIPHKYSEALIMKEYMGLSYKEIAESLEISSEVVRTRIFRAKAQLRELLAPYLEELNKL